MDGWTNGWMDGDRLMVGCMDDGRMNRQRDGRIDEQVDTWVGR